MANETIVTLGTPVTLEANGAAISNNNVGIADDDTYVRSSDGGGFRDVLFRATLTFATAPTENAPVIVLLRPLNIGGAGNHAETPENGATTFKGLAACAFVVNNVTTAQYVEAVGYNVPADFEAYLWNNATGQTISAGWTLTATPQTDDIA
jgi:hypothetical protein